MRMKIVAMCVVLAAAVAGGRVAAGEPARAPETRRIGIVFFEQVIKNYKYAQDMEERMRATYTPEQERIEAEIGRIQELERGLQNNPLKPQGGAPWRKSMMEIESAKLEVQAMQEEFARRASEDEAAFWQAVYTAFQRACRTMAEHYQYDIIFSSPDMELPEPVLNSKNPMVIQEQIMLRRVQYVSVPANLTKAVTDLLNYNYQQHLQNPQTNPL